MRPTPGTPPAPPTATWLWKPPPDIGAAIGFADACGVRDVAVSVPWNGVTPMIAATVRAFRGAGISVTALGSGTYWPLDPSSALEWAERAMKGADFDGLHLDVEFWTLAQFTADPVRWTRGFVELVGRLRETVDEHLTVDLAAGLAVRFPDSFRCCAAAASTVTLLAYRDRAGDLLEFSAAGRGLLGDTATPYRLGVETQRVSTSVLPHMTFGDDGRAVLDRELTDATSMLGNDSRFRGWAVHHLTSWMDLPGRR